MVTLYLLPEVNLRLMPVLQKGLKPGARIVSHDFDMGDWKADKKEEGRGRPQHPHHLPVDDQGRRSNSRGSTPTEAHGPTVRGLFAFAVPISDSNRPFARTHGPAMPNTYDAIIIGAGHNGLVTAAYLAKAGYKVLVLERREIVGGCCITEELWPGFKVSTAAYVNSLLRPEIIRDLELKKYGFEMLPRSPSSFTPVPGRPLSDDGAGQGDDAPRDREVLEEGRGGVPEVRGHADARRGLPRTDADADAARSRSRCGLGNLWKLGKLGLKFRGLGQRRRDRGGRDPDRRRAADPRPLVRVGGTEGDHRHRRGDRRVRAARRSPAPRTCCSTTSWASATAFAACGATSAAAWGWSRTASPPPRRATGAEIRTNAEVGKILVKDGARRTASRSRTAPSSTRSGSPPAPTRTSPSSS